jgi:hypothetical protein
MMNKISHELWILRGKWLQALFGFANQLALIARFISYEKWVLERKKHPSEAHLEIQTQENYYYLKSICVEHVDISIHDILVAPSNNPKLGIANKSCRVVCTCA